MYPLTLTFGNTCLCAGHPDTRALIIDALIAGAATGEWVLVCHADLDPVGLDTALAAARASVVR
jgi:hypothetical protein